jgi:hypothetical protein
MICECVWQHGRGALRCVREIIQFAIVVEETMQACRRMPKCPMARMTVGIATSSCSDIHVVGHGAGKALVNGHGTT